MLQEFTVKSEAPYAATRAVCPECGYVLDEQATTTACSECGLVLDQIIVESEAWMDAEPKRRQVIAIGSGVLALGVAFGFFYGFISPHSAYLAHAFGLIAILVGGGCWAMFARRSAYRIHRFWMMPDAVLLHSSKGHITRLPWTDLHSAVSSRNHPCSGSFVHRLEQRSISPLDLNPPDAQFCTLRFTPSWNRWWLHIPARLIVRIPPERHGEFNEKLRKVLQPDTTRA